METGSNLHAPAVRRKPSKPIPPRVDLRQEVYVRLRRTVLELALGSGGPTELREVDLARSLGVSRTPVREALNRLQQEGLVTRAPHRKIQVVSISPREYLAWLQVREVLEALAAQLAARRVTPAELAEMRAVFRKFTPENFLGRPGEYAAANFEFHALVARASGNPVLQRLIAQAFEYTQMARFRAPQSHLEHLAVIDALEAKDAARAGQLMRRHVRELRVAVSRTLKREV